MKLTDKTRQEIETALADKTRADLLDLIHRLVSFDRLLTAREIAEASHVAKRDVLEDMRAGRFVDPIFGPGFFCRASNSLRVSAAAAQAWRASFFVSVSPDSIPAYKKEGIGAGSHLDAVGIALKEGTGIKGKVGSPVIPAQTDLDGKKSKQKCIRDLSEAFHAGQTKSFNAGC